MTRTKTQTFSGARLEEIRQRRHLTQHDLASQLRLRGYGTTQATVSRWESYPHSGQQPHAGVLPALADELNCSIADFYALAESDEDDEEDAPLSREEFGILGDLMSRLGATLIMGKRPSS